MSKAAHKNRPAHAAGATSGQPVEVRGARTWATGAVAFAGAAQATQPALVNGSVGLVPRVSARSIWLCWKAEAGLSPVENLSKRRADRVENLCAKINFCADQASFVRERRRALSFVLRFACSPTANA